MGSPRKRSGGRSPKNTGPGSRRRSPGRSISRGATINQVSPVGNAGSSRPTIRATVNAREGAIPKSDIHIYLDGQGVGDFQYNRGNGSLSFTPSSLSSGAHTVEIRVGAGGSIVGRRWSFVLG